MQKGLLRRDWKVPNSWKEWSLFTTVEEDDGDEESAGDEQTQQLASYFPSGQERE